MKAVKVWKWVLVGVLVLAALYILYPTFVLLLGNPDPETVEKYHRKAVKVGLDLKGGTHLKLELDRSKVPPEHEGDPIDEAIQIIRNRVDQFGVAEPTIQKYGNDRIIVELPGVKDPELAKEIIGKTALLEFKLLRSEAEVKSFIQNVDKLVASSKRLAKILEGGEVDTITGSGLDTTKISSQGAPAESAKTHPAISESVKVTKGAHIFAGKESTATEEAKTEEEVEEKPFSAVVENLGDFIGVPVSEYPAVKKLVEQPEIQKLVPEGAQLAWSVEEKGPQGTRYRYLYLLNKQARLTGLYLSNANYTLGSPADPDAPGLPVVNLTFNKAGARIFSEITGANINKKLAIVLDSTVFSAPVIRTRIREGRARITGIKSLDEAKTLAIVLRAGALPAPLEVVEQRSIGPSLGEDSIRKGLLASIIGLVLVLFFTIFYYRLSGVIAIIALTLNLLFLFAAMSLVNATLTLPGVAGIILSLGMAVDANVLIFERIREELRSGKSVAAAIDSGYGRAFWTVFDSNLTTLIAGIVLYKFGTGPIRGFAVTLSFGIVISMFTAIFVTRLIQDYIVATKKPETLSI